MDIHRLKKRVHEVLMHGELTEIKRAKGVVVGHNSDALAVPLAHVWMYLLQEYFDSIHYVELATPSICQYAMHEFSADYGFWLYVATAGKRVNGYVEIYSCDGGRQRYFLFENEELDKLIQVFATVNPFHVLPSRLVRFKCHHEPNFIVEYLQSLTSQQIPKYKIQRERFRIVARFYDSFHTRFIIHYLNSLGCKVIPLLHEPASGMELARTVLSHQAVCGIMFDDCLNLHVFSTEHGEIVDAAQDGGVNDILLQRFMNGSIQHKHIESLLQHSYAVDGVWIVTRLLEWMTDTNLRPSELLIMTDMDEDTLQQGNEGDLRTCQGT